MNNRYPFLWVTLLLISFGGLNYIAIVGWWCSALGTVLIFFFSWMLWRREFLAFLGIPVSIRDMGITFFLLFLILTGSYFLLNGIAQANNISARAGHVLNYFHIFFYTLNEEFVLGAVLLFSLQKKYPRLHPILLSVITALLFALIHYTFFRWIFIPPNRGLLSLLTLLNLFMIGIVRNNTILKFRHIGYAWSLHCGWMMIMFGFNFFHTHSGGSLTEPERFNLFIGNFILTAIIVFLVFITTLFLILRSKKV